ncbi:SIR2 family protein [Nocardioides fonticola]|uniref:SIR2 family NAD-dependent protein deacylase n=1 Tax=Nocardioides fonticola TaxID=450363 RepID=UPI0031E238AA
MPEFQQLIEERRLLDAASLLKWLAKKASMEQDFFAGVREAVEGKVPNLYQGSAWHEAILRLDPDVIYTTNFDQILERASKDGFDTHLFESKHVGRELRRKSAIIVKIHGSVSHIEDIVLTRQDFARVRVAGSHALEVLRALLTTRCALLLGYSLGDPDIQLLFENVLDGRAEAPAHYMYTEDSLPEYEREILRDNYGIVPITYAAGRYDLGLAGLEELADQVEAFKAPI